MQDKSELNTVLAAATSKYLARALAQCCGSFRHSALVYWDCLHGRTFITPIKESSLKPSKDWPLVSQALIHLHD